jgi:hypothetical protein
VDSGSVRLGRPASNTFCSTSTILRSKPGGHDHDVEVLVHRGEPAEHVDEPAAAVDLLGGLQRRFQRLGLAAEFDFNLSQSHDQAPTTMVTVDGRIETEVLTPRTVLTAP